MRRVTTCMPLNRASFDVLEYVLDLERSHENNDHQRGYSHCSCNGLSVESRDMNGF